MSKWISLFPLLFIWSCSEIERFDSPKPAMISGQPIIEIYNRPDYVSGALKRLREGTIVFGLAKKASDSRDGSQVNSWYLVRTRSGIEGWSNAQFIKFVTQEMAEKEILRDKQAFTQELRNTILDAARNKIEEAKIHPASKISTMRITTSINPKSTSSYDANVSTLMIGNFLGINKYRVDLRVNLFMDIDKDFLSSSKVEMQYVEVIADQQTEGLSVQDVMEKGSLLKLLNLGF